jgi:tetratricopeptide (TPR) repeat protein
MRARHAMPFAIVIVASCASSPDKETLASLHSVKPDVADVEVQDTLDLALQSYRRFLDETPTSAMTPEAMRRLADLQIEREFGITGGEAGKRIVEMPAPSTGAVAATPPKPADAPVTAVAQESDDDFERRTTEQYRPASSSAPALDAPGADKLSEAGPLEAIAIYQRLLDEYPSYERSDQVLYQMARAYDELGRTEESMAVTERLIKQYGYSKYADEVQFRRGEYFFTRRKYRDAEDAYQAVVSTGPGSEFYELALYKLGWSLFKQDFYEEALQRYMALLDYKLSIGYDFDAAHAEEDERRVADTFRVISLSFSNLGGNEVLQEYFSTYGNRTYEDRIYKNLAEFYFGKLRYNDAATVYESFVKRYPFHRVSPEFSMRVIGIYEAGGFPKLVVESKKDFAHQYGVKSAYWQHFDMAERQDVAGYLKTNLHDLANYYHSLYQDQSLAEEKPAHYAEALVWYREFLDSFPQDPESPDINYQLADLLLENKDFAEAAVQYERTAYGYPPHERAAAAGYAAIFAHREHLKVVSPEQEEQAKRATVVSSLRFADTFPDHEYAAVVLGAAAEDLYAMKDYPAAVSAGQALIQRYPSAELALRRSAWEVVAHSSFELGEYAAAEPAYSRVLELVPEDDPARQGLVDNLAASIYKQGEQAAAAQDYRAAADDYLRVKTAAPTSSIRPNAEYDAAAALMRVEDWKAAAAVLEAFRTAFPDHELQKDATKQLAIAYQKGGQLSQAAGEYERVAAEADDGDQVRGDALLAAGELYEQAGNQDGALAVYLRYVKQFERPAGVAIETRQKIADMYKTKGDTASYEQQLKQIVAADSSAGDERTDRTRYLAAHAALVLAEPLYPRFAEIKLMQPFDKSLAKKREAMDQTLHAFESLVDYEVGDVTAAATYYMAEVYYAFSRALLESERPSGLSNAEQADYEDALQEQAFPFEERAIQVHQKNIELVAAGTYNDWIEKSLGKLAALVPGRYAKAERSVPVLASLDTYTYRQPAAGEAPTEPTAEEAESGGKRGRSSAPKKPAVGLEVVDGVGFTVTEAARVANDVRADFERAAALVASGQAAAGIPILVSVTERAPELAAPYIDLGLAYEQTGKLDDAAAALEKAVQADAKHPLAYHELGLVYRKQGRVALARQTYEKGVAVYPLFDTTRRNLGILCEIYLGDLPCALRNYQAYREAAPEDKDATLWVDDLSNRRSP